MSISTTYRSSSKGGKEMSNPKELMKSLSGIENINEWIQNHTVLTNGQREVVLPYTVDVMIGTKNQTSSLDDDLRNIDKHIEGVLNGSILVGHAAKADKLTASRKIMLSGDASGEVSFDGSKDVTIPVVISDNSHNHEISNITGLQEALDEKLSADHQHEEWHSFKTVSTGEFGVEATTVEDTLNLIAGKNIVLSSNSQEKSITIDAVMTEVEAATATTLRGIKIQYDANRSQNEQYIPVVSYSLPLEIGPNIDFHLSGSTKDFDGRLLVNPAGVLHYTSDGQETYRVFHEGNDGHNSGLDADTLDGKHASAFSSSDHNHDDRYLSGTNGEMPTDLILANGKFVKGRKTDKTIHQLIGVSGGNVLDLGSTTLPLTIWSEENPCVGVGSSRKAIYHEGNKPSWLRDILDIPSTFTPSAHQHTSSEISDATSNNTPNTVARRDNSGSLSVNDLLSSGALSVGLNIDANNRQAVYSSAGIMFKYTGESRIETQDSKTGSIAFHTGATSIADVLKLNSDGTATFGNDVSIQGFLSMNAGAKVNGSLTVTGASTFNNTLNVNEHGEFKKTLAARSGITTPTLDMGDYMKLNTGADGTGFDNKNNANIDTWFGFSVSNLCSGQTIGVGKPAFSVNARNGNTYAAGNFYASKNKRVYHEGNFFFSTSDSPSGGVNGDLWFTYEA